jgi:hypothetical protein
VPIGRLASKRVEPIGGAISEPLLRARDVCKIYRTGTVEVTALKGLGLGEDDAAELPVRSRRHGGTVEVGGRDLFTIALVC